MLTSQDAVFCGRRSTNQRNRPPRVTLLDCRFFVVKAQFTATFFRQNRFKFKETTDYFDSFHSIRFIDSDFSLILYHNNRSCDQFRGGAQFPR